MNSSCLRPAGIFLVLAAIHLLLYAQMPDARRDKGWPTIVMHNWHESGVAALGGQLVANPGGLDAGEEKFVYPGHRPGFLAMPYLLKELPGPAGGNGLLYDFTVLALTFGALVWLFGNNFRGIFIACAVCLTAGFMNNVGEVDTLSIPGLLGLAAMSFAAGCLVREKKSVWLTTAALAVMAAFMLLNWSALFSLGVAAVYVACKRRDWFKSALLLSVPLLVGLGVLYVSMHSRHATASNSGTFWNAYLWGPLGYDGAGMTTGKAFVRITAVNAVAWLSLIVAAIALLRVNGLGANWRRAIWPLLAGIAAVFALRNYNAHHPWNSVCIIGLGFVFSLELLTGSEAKASARSQKIFAGAASVFSLVYLIAWLALDEYNQRGMITVLTLVSDHTPRHSQLVAANDLLPAGVTDYKPFAEAFDRKLVSLEEWNRRSAELRASGKEIYFLTHAVTPPPEAKLVAESRTRPTLADKIMVPLFDFYREKISRRAPGNRKTYYDDYKLYKL